MDNYKIPEDKITVTINGIDTDKFSPDTDASRVKNEFGITDGDRVIVYVSRMDTDRSLAAHMLISALPKLCKVVDGLRLLVVGGGNDYDKIAEEAADANKIIGRDAIMLAGARTEINEFAAAAELFVGVSRAALEAMAAGKPTIIAGNEGYIGLFDEDKAGLAYSTNFCCRGCEASSEEKLAQDIGNFFGMWEEDKKHLSEFSREYIKKNYSVSRMADDAEKVYKNVLAKRKG